MAHDTEGLERVDGSSGHHLRPYQQELLNAAIEDNVRSLDASYVVPARASAQSTCGYKMC